FDTPAAPAPAAAAVPAIAAAPEIGDFVARVLADREQPVVLFALEWCEFCWALRKLFAKAGIPHRSVDLDSAAYQRDDRGGHIRAVLRAKLGTNTIPQVFVGGEHIGGCTETLEAYKTGRLQQMLDASGVGFDRTVELDPFTLLPGWLHGRR